MTLKKSAILGTLWSVLGSSGREFLGLLVFLILARTLGPEAYGLLGMAMAVVALTHVLVGEHTTEVLVQRQRIERPHLDAAFWAVLLLGAALGAAIFASAGPLAKMYQRPELKDITRVLALMPVLAAVSAVPFAILRRRLQFRLLAYRSLATVIVGGIVGIGMAAAGWGVWSLVGLQLAQKVTEMAVLWIGMDWRPGVSGRWRHLRDLLNYSGQMIAIRLTGYVGLQVPRMMIGVFFGATALGYFTVGWRVLEVATTVLVTPMSQVALPVFARFQTRPNRLGEILRQVMGIAALFALPCFVGAILVAPEIIPLVLGGQWAPATPVIQMLLALGPLIGGIYFLEATIRALGRPDRQLLLVAIGTVTNLAVVFALRDATLIWAVAAIVLRGYLLFPLNLLIAGRLTATPVRVLVADLWRVLLACAVMAGAALALRAALPHALGPVALISGTLLAAAAAYVASALLVARPAVREALSMLRVIAPRPAVASP